MLLISGWSMMTVNTFWILALFIARCEADLSPLIQYAGQSLILCNKADPVRYTECLVPGSTELSIDSTSQRRSCTSDPSTFFSCVSADDAGCQCESKCTTWVSGWEGITFPALCMPVNFQLEDSWTNVATFFLHDPGAGVPPQDPTVAPFTGTLIRFNATVWYGRLDVYHLGNNCTVAAVNADCKLHREEMIDIITNLCSGRSDAGCKADMDSIARDNLPQLVSFREVGDGIFAMRSITIVGSFAQVTAALLALKYLPDTLGNTNRLRSRLYNPGFSKVRPYETLDIQIDLGNPCPDVRNQSFCFFAPCQCVGNTLKGRLSLVRRPRRLQPIPPHRQPQNDLCARRTSPRAPLTTPPRAPRPAPRAPRRRPAAGPHPRRQQPADHRRPAGGVREARNLRAGEPEPRVPLRAVLQL
jgi:hypothetical protein